MATSIKELSWVGSQTNFVDTINITEINHISIGRFGGNSKAGQYKNEDGCLIWLNEQEGWELAVILDAHNSAQSAALVLKQFSKWKREIQQVLSISYDKTFKRLYATIVSLFQEETFLSDCKTVQGETACLIVIRKDKYIWWFSVGDCLSFVFHPEFSNLGQYQLNQRQFFEWIGQVNTFEQVVPCYSTGIRELRKGINRIFLTTDGLMECPNEPFSSPKEIYNVMCYQNTNDGMLTLLKTIKANNVRDSTTIISWDIKITEEVTIPSDC